MNGGKQQDDRNANPRKSACGAQSEHTACGQLWGKARGNWRTTREAQGRTCEESARVTRLYTTGQCRLRSANSPLWTQDAVPTWDNRSCPHPPPHLLRLRSLLSLTTSQPTVGVGPSGHLAGANTASLARRERPTPVRG